jgi:ribonuclease E
LSSPALPVIILVDLIIIDRVRALLNVWGDAVGASVIAQTFEMKTAPRKISHSKKPTDRRERMPRQDRSRRSSSDRPDRHQRDTRRGGGSDRSRGRDRQERPDRGGRGRSRDRENDTRSEARDNSPFQINARQSSGIDMDTAAKIEKPDRPDRSTQDRPERTSDSTDRSRRRTDSRSSSRSNGRSSSDRSRSSSSSSSTGSSPESIPAETIKRERAKVAAQLAAMKQDEPIAEPQEVEPFEDEEVKIERPVEDTEPEANETTERDKKSARPEPKASEPEEKEEEVEPKKVNYGRSRSRKGPKYDDDTETTGEETTERPKEPEFTTEDISFGRGKRKKTR